MWGRIARDTAFRRILVILLGTAAASLLTLVWLYRVELQVSFHWRRAKGLLALRENCPGDPAFSASLNWGLSRWDFTLCRLIRLRRPDFLGGRDFQLEAIRTREGDCAFFVHYDPLHVPFDEEPDPDPDEAPEIVVIYCPAVVRHLAILDSAGKLRGEPRELIIAEGHSFRRVADPEGILDRLRIRAACRGEIDYQFSVDREGLINEGLVTSTELPARIDALGSIKAEPVDLDRLLRLLDSPASADLYRALSLLETGDPRHLHLVGPLLDHRDSRLRGRAATLLVKDPALAPLARPLLEDPSPGVRFAALQSAAGLERWEEAVWPLTGDPHPEIARAAHVLLMESEDPKIASRSLLHLYRNQDRAALSHDCRGLESVDLAEAILSWLEDPAAEEAFSALESNLLDCLPAGFLRPFLARLLALYHSRDPEPGLRQDLAVAIARIDDPEGNEVLRETMTPEEFLEVCELARRPDDSDSADPLPATEP